MTRKRIIVTVLYFVGVMLVLLLCARRGLLCYEIESGNGAAYEQKVESVAYGYALAQTIIPQYDHIASVMVHVDMSERQQESGRLQATLTDSEGNVAAVTALEIAKLPSYGWCELALDARVEAGAVYTLSLEALDCADFGPRISIYPALVAASAEEEGGTLLYAGSPLSYVGTELLDAALRLNIVYRILAPWYAYALYYLCAGVLWGAGAKWWDDRTRRTHG